MPYILSLTSEPRFSQPARHKDLNPGLGKRKLLSVFSSPLSDLRSQGQLPGERKEISMNALIWLRKTTPVFVVASALAWFTLPPTSEAVVPPPDGGYPGFN